MKSNDCLDASNLNYLTGEDIDNSIIDVHVDKIMKWSMIEDARKLNKAILNFHNLFSMVNVEQFILLLQLFDAEKDGNYFHTITNMAIHFDVQRPTLSRCLIRLRKGGLIEELINNDRRCRRNILTKLGREFVEKHVPMLLKTTKRFVGIVGEDRLSRFLTESKEIINFLNDMVDGERIYEDEDED